MEKDRKEGIRGMANPGRYGIERVAYWLMRITGLGLLAYFIGHIYETSSLLDGKAAWNSMLELTQTTEGHIFLALVIGTGFGFGKARRPDYPYTPSSLNMKNKLCIYVSIGLAALAMMYGLGVMYDV